MQSYKVKTFYSNLISDSEIIMCYVHLYSLHSVSYYATVSVGSFVVSVQAQQDQS